MSLDGRLFKRLGVFDLDVDITCAKGETLCVVGPSGSGKTTMLRLLAGLEKADKGRVRLDGRTWLDCGAGICLSPQRRSAGLVFQDYNLFPHMSLKKNVAYAAVNRELVDELLETFGIAHLADMPPSRISGGERQRGALCQALARMPKLLLLDEPFSALDLETRLGLRKVLRRVQRDHPLCLVHVTHDLTEALFLGDRIMALKKGRPAPGWLERQLDLLRREQDMSLGRGPAASIPPGEQEARSLCHA